MPPTGAGQWFRLASGSPPLALSEQNSGQLVASWPSLATGYTLLRCDDLSTGLWEPEPAPIQITNGLHRATINSSEAHGFFRLVSPASQ